MKPDVVALTGVGVGELRVPVVRERHVARTALREVADVVEVERQALRQVECERAPAAAQVEDPLAVSQACLPLLRQARGRIVNLSSVASLLVIGDLVVAGSMAGLT